jgi:hypothetical protein
VDKFNFLIVEAINESAYGFNLSVEVEKAAAIQVVTDKDDFTVVGWSIGKIIPNWVKSFDEWNIYISEKVSNGGDSNIVHQQKLRNDGGLQQNVEEGEKDLFDNYSTNKIKQILAIIVSPQSKIWSMPLPWLERLRH